MTALNKYRLKIFLTSGLAFAGITAALDLWRDDGSFSWLEFFIKFLLFGGLMAWNQTRMQQKQLKQYGLTEIKDGYFDPVQTDKFKSRIDSLEEAADILSRRTRFKKADFNRDSANRYTIIRGGWLKLGGEEITLTRTADLNGDSYFEVSSKNRNGGAQDALQVDSILNLHDIRKVLAMNN